MERTNEEWLADLQGENTAVAIADLRTQLIKGLRYTLYNRVDTDVEPLAEDFAQEALLKILDNLDSFRGESKFLTWSQKIAVRVAFTELRRKRWTDYSLEELTTSADGTSLFEPSFMSDEAPGPEDRTSQKGLLMLVNRLIMEELTERQREAMTSLMLKGLPMDMVADQMNTNRNALYKLMHDARVRLKTRLEEEGLTPEDVLAVF